MWHFLIGYVILQIEGLSVARFLRRIADNGIEVRNVQRLHDSGAVRCEIDLKHVFKLHRIKRGLPVRIRIVKRCGLPFCMQKARKRPVLCIGTLFMITALSVASGRIWIIRVEGTEQIDPGSIIDVMKDYGLRIGARPKGAVLIEAANDISVRIHDAAWIGFDREGVTLKVKVVEALKESEKRALVGASDIVADKDGIVTEIIVMRGQACVKVGDTVHQGDVLISGSVQWKDASYQTDAIGTIRAAVHYESASELPSSVIEAVQSDETEIVRSYCIGSYPIFEMKPSFERYRLSDERTISVSDRFPVYCIERTAQRIDLKDRDLSEEESEQYAMSSAREDVLESIPKDAVILNQYGSIRNINGKSCAVVIVTTEETIGRTEEYLNDR